jgi:hypothetical protein
MKKPVTLPFVLLVAAILILTSPATASAGGRKSSSSQPPIKVDNNDRITAFHLTSVIVTIAATHQSKEYKVTPATKFTVNNRPGTLNDLATGMDVRVTTAPNDPTVAATVEAKTSGKK